MTTDHPDVWHSERLGISIAGGGARIGWLGGAVAALLEHPGMRSRIRVIYGSSAGALVGAVATASVVTDDLSPMHELARELATLSPLAFAGIDIRTGPMAVIQTIAGWCEGEECRWGIEDLVKRHMPVERWRRIVRAGDRVRRPVELGICVTRADTLEAETITTRGCRDSRTLTRALVASASVPGLFPPVRIWNGSDHEYVDGCVVDLNPSSLLAESDLACDLDGLIIVGPSPVTGDPHRPVRTPVRSVGERVARLIGGEDRIGTRATCALPVLRIGPETALPGGPLAFAPDLLQTMWRAGYVHLRQILAATTRVDGTNGR